jgi:hypothetical protein
MIIAINNRTINPHKNRLIFLSTSTCSSGLISISFLPDFGFVGIAARRSAKIIADIKNGNQYIVPILGPNGVIHKPPANAAKKIMKKNVKNPGHRPYLRNTLENSSETNMATNKAIRKWDNII